MAAVFMGCHQGNTMTDPIKLTDALWDAAQAEDLSNALSQNLQALHRNLPDEYNDTLTHLTDQANTLRSRLETLKHELLILTRDPPSH